MVTKKAAGKKASAKQGGGKRSIKDLDAKRKGTTVKGGGGNRIGVHGPGPVGPDGTGG